MYLFLLLTSCWCVSASATSTSAKHFDLEKADVHFKNFIAEFNKQYATANEREARFQIFKNNLEKVNRLNEESEHAVFGITQFMDLTHEEFVSKHTGLRVTGTKVDDYDLCKDLKFDRDIKDAGAPDSFDWRDKNVVTDIKSQGSCGSCWAFSATANVESQYAIKHGQRVSLSEQELVDCDKVSKGCDGGLPASAFKALMGLGGQTKEADYPYVEIKSQCYANRSKVVAKVTGCSSYDLTSQDKVKQLLYKYGPISIAIYAIPLMAYTKGIMSDTECEGPIDHAVLLVGYGTENGQPYWIAKNSWGPLFGEKGYFRMQRSDNRNGACSMLNVVMATSVVE